MDLADLKNFILIPTVLVYLWKRKGGPRWLDALGAVLLLTTAVETTAWVLRYYSISNLPLYNLFVIANVYLISRMIAATINDGQRISILGTIVVSVLLLYQLVYGAGLGQFASGMVVVSGLIIGAYAGFALYRLAESTDINIGSEGVFWVLAAYLIYYLCFAPSMGLVGYLMFKDAETTNTLLEFNDILFLVHFAMIMIGMWRVGKLRTAT